MSRYSIDAMITFLTARINEDEADAYEAIDAERPGTTWRWFRSEDDAPLTNPAYEDTPAYLATTEEYPSSVGMLPAMVLQHVETDDPQAFPHIARHDPKRVLADVAGKRAIIQAAIAVGDDGYYTAEYMPARTPSAGEVGSRRIYPGHPSFEQVTIYAQVLRALVGSYADHPDYDASWSR